MDLRDWIAFGLEHGLAKQPQHQEMFFREVYQMWFRMKLRTIREQSCDRIECTYNRYYKGSFIEVFPVSDISEKVVIRFLSDIVVGLGGVSYKEFGRIYQIINNVLVYAKDMQLGGVRLLDWSMIKRYVQEEYLPFMRQGLSFGLPMK